MEQAEKGQVKSLVKALELLDILSNQQAPMTLRELYQVSGYPKSTITRCCPPCAPTAASGRRAMADTTWE